VCELNFMSVEVNLHTTVCQPTSAPYDIHCIRYSSPRHKSAIASRLRITRHFRPSTITSAPRGRAL
jgi:hypothetical protein